MNKNIQLLNRYLGESLGRPDGVHSRYAWLFAPDVPYFYRRQSDRVFERRSWGQRLGNVWVLCQWRLPLEDNPPITEQEWKRAFNGQFPYPRNGEYRAYAETALVQGLEPTAGITFAYIGILRRQMEQAEQANKEIAAGRMDAVTEKCEREAQQQVDEASAQFDEMVGNWEPLSWKKGEPHNPGDQDGPVSFGGV